MCGIYICLGTNENEINNKQEHRGPDEHVIHTRGSDVWIFDRLSINDVEFGGQPFMDDQHVFMCNGEIYNHMSLSNEIVHELQSKSDCEPLFHLLNKCCEYDEFDQVCKNIDGEFAFVYANENHYVVARDPLGVRPLFMCVDRIYPNIVLGIGSEAKSLLHLPGTIQQLPPGNCMVLDRFYHVVHQNDYIHRDLKPENILCSYEMHRKDDIKIKLADFGLAAHFKVSLSQKDQLMERAGTFKYMAPEQAS